MFFMMRYTLATLPVTGTAFFCAGTIYVIMWTGHGSYSFLARFFVQRYKKNLTYARIPPQKTPRELIFHPKNQKSHPKTTPTSSEKGSEKGSEKTTQKTPQKKQQKTWIVSKPMDDVTQMRFGANGQRTVTIGRVWAARYHGIMVSRYTDKRAGN